jgi:transcription antitermination factor NusB
MRTRTLSREAALQYLSEVDVVGLDEAEDVTPFLERQLGRREAREYAAELVEGVLASRAELDQVLAGVSENWTLERMSVVDRNVLRIGAYELRCRDDIPPKVAINEGVNLARRFSSEEAAAFVNGILDRIRLSLSPESGGGREAKVDGA